MNKHSDKTISITTFREMLFDELLELDKSQIAISDSPTTSTKRGQKTNHKFEESIERDYRTEKLEKGAFIAIRSKPQLSVQKKLVLKRKK